MSTQEPDYEQYQKFQQLSHLLTNTSMKDTELCGFGSSI